MVISLLELYARLFVVDSVGVTVGSEGQYDPDSLFPN